MYSQHTQPFRQDTLAKALSYRAVEYSVHHQAATAITISKGKDATTVMKGHVQDATKLHVTGTQSLLVLLLGTLPHQPIKVPGKVYSDHSGR